PLPAAPFVLATWSAATVGPDIHAKVGATLYSLPWRFLGERVDARSTRSMARFFRHGELIKTHPRKERGKQTDFGDYPPEKIAFHMRTPTWCKTKAAEIGPACEIVISELLADNTLFRLRAAQGVLGLGERHDPGRLEAACAKATTAGDPSYRTIKGILAAGTEATAPPDRPTGDAGAPAHLHGPDQLFAEAIADVIAWLCPTPTGPTLASSGMVLPDEGWGELYLPRSAPTTGTAWGDSGKRRDRRGLKHRPREEIRSVPCAPPLTQLLHQHITEFGTATDGRLIQGMRGGDLSDSTYDRVWHKAREQALTPDEVTSPLARRPYDLRHAAVSTWLNGGVPPTQVAEWAGHSVAVLLRVYARCIAGQGQAAWDQISRALGLD
ncbi:MAG: hypothetical protein WCF33_00220, partial [Pseudonocardiaceae bacterium]